MIPISDDNPTLRTPVMTYLLIAINALMWFVIQGAGLDPYALAASVCNLGLVPGEITGTAPVGAAVPLGEGAACVVDREPINVLTPITSMFLHGGWGHIAGNMLYLWVFGNNVEDSMGRFRFVVFYLLCGLAAAGAQVLVSPSSPVPMVGASGAISGVMGAYLLLYPRVRVNVFFPPLFIFPVAALYVLLLWIATQVLAGLFGSAGGAEGAGVAFWAHIGGFVAGLVLVKVFEDRNLTAVRTRMRHQLHPEHP
ncbi:MAG TPA: rhomboid family intramembrane serine protease [Myxococcaceae bacterium]|jgi:membrane associated rhomboid family serine protease|nr:rhomboid family intramembrane serine protease [Myxococcaceae bacterium]